MANCFSNLICERCLLMRNNLRFVIIGGSDAGISAALRARDLDSNVSITVVLADGFPNFSICGLPFFLSGETPDWHQLAHRTEFKGIDLLTWHTAVAIDPVHKRVEVLDRREQWQSLAYDQLLIATGAGPLAPKIAGIDLPGVFTLHTMADSFAVNKNLVEERPRSAIIVGAGYIGVEMADALVHRGLQVTLVGKTTSVLPTVDPELGDAIGDELLRHKVNVITNVEVTGIESSTCLRVTGTNGFEASADFVLVAAGVKPASELAAGPGSPRGIRARFRWIRECERTFRISMRLGTALRRGIASSSSTDTCRLVPRRTSRDGLREKML